MSVLFRSFCLRGLMTALSLALFISAPVNAQISGGYAYDDANRAYFVTGDATVDGNIFGNDVFVGKDNAASFTTSAPTPPIVLTVNQGAFIRGFGNVYPIGDPNGVRYDNVNVFGGNKVNITGGNVDGTHGYDASTINISGGDVGSTQGFDSSVTNIGGGAVRNINDYRNSAFNLTSGSVLQSRIYDNSAANISGGNIGQVYAFDASKTNITGGIVNLVAGYDNNVTNISGGSLRFSFGANHCVTNISGGNVKNAYGALNSVTNISGGSVTDIYAYGDSAFNITGGAIGSHSLRLFEDSLLNLSGADFVLSDAIEMGSDVNGSYTLYTLTGLLTDGSSLNTDLFDYQDGGYDIAGGGPGKTPLYFNGNPVFAGGVAAPEPGALALFALALPVGIGMMRRPRAENGV